jgi:outer membrane protein OmpA-like peptidoglycan-associated protein
MYRIIRYYGGLSLLVIFTSLTANAQDQKPALKTADEYYDRFNYKQAIPLYEKLAKKNKVKTAVLEKLAISYLEINNYQKSADWYKLIITRSDADAESYLNYGDMLKSIGDYAKAKEVYSLYKQKGAKDVTSRVSGIDSAVIWLSKPRLDNVNNLSVVNTPASEWGAILDKDNNIIFSSDSLRLSLFDKKDKINKNIYGRTGRNFQKLYTYPVTGGGSSSIKQFSGVINSFRYHVGPLVFSNDQQTAYFTVTNAEGISHIKDKVLSFYGSRRLELFISKFKDGQWQMPVPFVFNNPANFSIGHAALSKDENTLYFVSDMPGGVGKTDIWYSEKSDDGSWGNPKNCGSSINTTEEEEFPTLAEDVLYFSSKGHPGMGGFDIFSSKGQKDQWSAAVNQKSPLNSQGDDFYLVMKDQTTGYFASNRPGGLGNDDIYTYNKTPEPAVVPEKPIPPIPPIIPVVINKPEKGEKFIIYYDFDKSKIRPDAVPVLDSLTELMNKYPGMTIALSSYTDSRGKDNYNQALSQRRAAAALAYLIRKGIAKDRIKADGYGETHLLNDCKNGVKCTEAEHQINRRTEVVVILM